MAGTEDAVDYNLSEGVTVEELPEELIDAFQKSQKSYTKGFVRLQPYNQVLPRIFCAYEKRVKEFKIYDDDIWIGSFPKCGTTWTEEMVWCIMHDLDFEAAAKTTLDERIPYFELVSIWGPDYDFTGIIDTIKLSAELPRQRILKTHLSAEMLPNEFLEKKAKLIYVARNPRDVCVSFFNHWKILEGFHGDFDIFVDAFLNDVCGYYTPFLQHVLEFWNLSKKESNVLFIFYEDMKRDLAAVIKKIGKFLGKEVSQADLPRLLDHLSFDKMKNNAAVNKQEWIKITNDTYKVNAESTAFMRKGRAGDWRSHLSEDQVRRFEAWEKKSLEGSDLKFNYG